MIMGRTFVIDSNIIFSAILRIESPIGKFIMAANSKEVAFYVPEFLKEEIEKHVPKIIQVSGKSESEVRKLISLLYTRILFVSDGLIPFECFSRALPYVKDIDMDDIVFVALNEYLEGACIQTYTMD